MPTNVGWSRIPVDAVHSGSGVLHERRISQVLSGQPATALFSFVATTRHPVPFSRFPQPPYGPVSRLIMNPARKQENRREKSRWELRRRMNFVALENRVVLMLCRGRGARSQSLMNKQAAIGKQAGHRRRWNGEGREVRPSHVTAPFTAGASRVFKARTCQGLACDCGASLANLISRDR